MAQQSHSRYSHKNEFLRAVRPKWDFPFLARSCRSGMSALRSLSGVKRTVSKPNSLCSMYEYAPQHQTVRGMCKPFHCLWCGWKGGTITGCDAGPDRGVYAFGRGTIHGALRGACCCFTLLPLALNPDR
jgi:hypothetical protein